MLNQIITQAIRERKKLQFYYHNKLRIVDPHVFGVSTKNNEVVLCWQTGGQSSQSGDLPNWRMFETNEIRNIQLMNDKFTPRSQRHNSFESDIKTVYAVV